ncbi:hypothetical protein Micbo1qcDRAFT_152337 [Microdochium bolleyi]|uniref:Peptidase M3A/M3B catalytic domain-containing protein n=1 Tax=Microdochium bolleyi TaxID=196109 RepID=A0A136IPJ2_9PEZI|nr:hypothetical protein Micbo1qcDRAFT_152337 [Microdochium bolleyi]
MDELNRYPPQPPLRFTSDPVAITAAADAACAHAQAVVDELLATVAPATATFDNVLGVLLQLENEFQKTSNVAVIRALTGGVTAGETSDEAGKESAAALRKAAGQAANKLSRFLPDLKADKRVVALVGAVYQGHQQDDGARLDAESWKALRQEYRASFSLIGGAPIPGSQERVAEIEKRLSDIQGKFLGNLDDAQDCIWLTRAELKGVPDATLGGLETRSSFNAEEQLRVELNGPQVRSILSHLAVPESRHLVYAGMKSLAAENIPLFHEAVQLRHEAARLCGYSSHAARRVETMMARTPEVVNALLDGLREKVLAQLPRDLEKLSQMSPGQSPDTISSADLPYYSSVYEQKNYSIDQEMIAQYFPLLPTVSRMLNLFGRHFGFTFQAITDAADKFAAERLAWHEDVLVYSVWNDEQEGGDFVGYLYLDLHQREGKTGGAQCRPLHLGCLDPTSGQRHYPSTVLLTSFARNSHLHHADVTLLFHEMGHGIHDLAGKCRYSRFHGAETVGDFNEAPSQMLENWCWDPQGLRALSGNHETGAPLPDDMVDAIVKTRAVLPAVKILEQLRVTLFDSVVHSDVKDGAAIDADKVYLECANLGGLQCEGDRSENSHGYTTYRHLFSGNDGTMYSYLWSRAIAQDMFDAFFAGNTLDDKVGRRYRHMVLEKGGSQDEMKTLVDFLGRKPSWDPFYRSLGL